MIHQQAQASIQPIISANEAGIKLARLMERQLGYGTGTIDNVALRLSVRAYWSHVSRLAHAIHDEVEL